MATFIRLGASGYRQDVEANGVAWDVPGDAYEIYRDTEGVIAYDALSVVARNEDADDVEERLAEAGHQPANRRPIYWCSGSEGFVLHRIHDDDD